MLDKVKSVCYSFRIKYHNKKQFETFLKNSCDLKLKDVLNNFQRPSNQKIRILGNGDSLTSSLSSLDNNCDYIVVNRHIDHPSFFEIKPKYYVLADPKWWLQEDCRDVTRRIVVETSWDMTLFIPHTANIDWLPQNEKVKVQRYNSGYFYGDRENQNYLYDHNLAMPVLQNVVVGAVYISIFLGYKSIELYGVEHSWTKSLFVDDKNVVRIYDSHFYDRTKVSARKFSEAHKQDWKFHEALQAYARMFESYWELKDIAERKGVKIVNCTPNSFIDAFDRQIH